MKNNKENETKVQGLKDALEVAKEFLREYKGNDKHNQIWSLFDSLVSLTIEEGESLYFEVKKPEELYYNKDQIIQKMRASNRYEPPSNTPRIDQLCNKLEKRLREVNVNIVCIAKRLGKSVYPSICIDKTSGGKGQQNRYYIESTPINDIAQLEIKPVDKQSKCLSYEVESELPKLPLWGRWIYPIINRNWLLLAIGLSPGVALVYLGFVIFMSNIGLIIHPSYSILVPIIYLMLYWLFFRFFTVVLHYNICMFPEMLLPLRLQSAVLEAVLNLPKSNLPLKKAIKLRVYRGTCPICGHRVSLAKRKFYSEEIIGVCEANPRMHRYTFDPTTKTGDLLKCS